MNNSNNLQPDERLEAYLDGTLPENERAAFAQRLEVDAEQRRQVELQQQIDRGLTSLFPAVSVGQQHVWQVAGQVAGQRGALARWHAWTLATAAAAAVLVGVTLAWPDRPAAPVPHFSATPVAELYLQTVRNGFEPYYHCEDDQRFAAVFARRQGVSLRLHPMPEGSRMLGLSYPGGVSRNTTAMLCQVDDQPVMVFVDRLEADQRQVALQPADDGQTRVFRETRDGLVFYEVSPFGEPRAIPYLHLVDRSASDL